MKHPFYKSIKGRFLLITLVLILMAGISTSAFSYQMFTRNMTNNLIHSTETSLQIFVSQINNTLNEICTLTDWCRNNSQILSFAMTPKTKSNYNRVTSSAADRLDEEFRYNPSGKYICRLVIAGSSRSDYLQVMPNASYSVDKPLPALIQELPYYDQLFFAEDYKFDIGFYEDPFLPSRPQMLPLIRPIYHPYQPSSIGFVYAEISVQLFTSITAQYSQLEGSPVYFTSGSRTYSITADGAALTHDLDSLTECAADTSVHTAANKNARIYKSKSESGRLYVTIPLQAQGCSLTLPISDLAFHEQLSGYLSILTAIFLFCSAAGILLISVLSHTVSRPVRLIRSRLSAIASGDFSKDASIEWDNEFGDIGRTVNQLAVDIQDLINSKIEYEKQQKDYEYQVLQSQINPHFLYNTLGSIKWMAAAQNASGIAEMATALSHLLKNISKGTRTVVTIQEEITLLNDYFTIQKYRYGGTITLTYDIESPALLDASTLRFTLQPIVENAIFHGIEPKRQAGHITIHIYQPEPDQVKIDITDDGIGMSRETIESVLSEDTSEKSRFFKQLGISSVNKQIKHTFGEAYGLTITSEPGVYTLMSVLLPYESLHVG